MPSRGACCGYVKHERLRSRGANRACDADPTHVAALDMLGEASLQAGDPEAARAALLRSVELAPDGAGCRYMSLGQLAEGGAETMRWFDRGLVCLPRPHLHHHPRRCATAPNPADNPAGEAARGAECNRGRHPPPVEPRARLALCHGAGHSSPARHPPHQTASGERSELQQQWLAATQV
jgi:hypothetical protein